MTQRVNQKIVYLFKALKSEGFGSGTQIFNFICKVWYALPRSVAQGFSTNPHMLTEEEEGEGRNHGRVVEVRLQNTTFLSSDSGFETPSS